MEKVVRHLIGRGGIKKIRIISAFQTIDRKEFVLHDEKENPYGDDPLSIGDEQTISQPTTVAFMLELLAFAKKDKILDVGSGSGWTTALLAHLTGTKGKVYGMEIIPKLVKLGNDNLAKYEFPHAEIFEAGETLGLPVEAPFDKILFSAAD